MDLCHALPWIQDRAALAGRLMGPCVFCHRRGVTQTSEGYLCSACAMDHVEDLRAYPEDEEIVIPKCFYPEPCGCDECIALDEFE